MTETPLSERARETVALAALAAWPLLLLLDSGVALARGWRSQGVLARAAAGGCGVAILLALALWLLPAGRRLLAHRWAAIATLVAALSLGWLAAEGTAAAFPSLLGNRLGHSRGPRVRRLFRPDPRYFTGIAGPSRYTTNELGIRGGPMPAAAGVTRLLCIGASTTECTYLDDEETWPYLLMADLDRGSGRRTWVGGLGISGYTTFEHLDFLRHAPRLPVDGAVFLVGVNDFVRALNGSLELGPRPLWRRSALLSAALEAGRRATLRHLLYEVEDETGAHVEDRRQRRRQAGHTDALPDLRQALRDYGERVAALAGECRRRRLRCLFLTQPVLWRQDLAGRARDSLWMGENAGGRFLPPGPLRQGMDRYNATLLAQCSRLGLECVDLAPAMSGREELFFDDCHFTEAGARVVARLVAGYLLSHPEGRG
ncbi:MAG: SGNH/GDSL hydrolase family protein [Acidobacteria bacterium]|nr:SGNH/GDSL hydrolase family protein [Acidobacteriota bacterium]